jgi:hypothetical protein
MGGFFQGWRRKTGCATLVMACVFMAGWVRSQSWFDNLKMPWFDGSVVLIQSFGGGIDFCRRANPFQRNWYFESMELAKSDWANPDGSLKPLDPWPVHQVEWRRDWAGFHLGAAQLGQRRDQDLMIPYWSIAIPLTFLSARLLVGKSRKCQ